MNARPFALSLDGLRVDNRFVQQLPGDSEPRNFVRQVRNACYSRVTPTPVVSPSLVAYSREVAELIGLQDAACESQNFADVFAGNRVPPAFEPFAMCYGGHQFGSWAGQLGDGRAINLAEVLGPNGDRWVLQLKGAGPTPYSRTADGLAVMRSSVREFLCSEAMHHLGVPTTRALCLIATGEDVRRDMFYDGNPRNEPGAICCRVAPSFLRFGNYQIFASRGEMDLLRQLVDYTLVTDFPHLGTPTKDNIVAWFHEVCQRTAEMIVHWTRVGFVHGVMNTDNMSILGLTIDYGPYGWMEEYDPSWTPNTTDAHGRRYAYGQQPAIAGWNLLQLANALFSLVEDKEGLQAGLDAYTQTFSGQWHAMIAAKLGLESYEAESDDRLTEELFALMYQSRADMTIFFRNLSKVSKTTSEFSNVEAHWSHWITLLQNPFYGEDSQDAELDPVVKQLWCDWFLKYQSRLQRDSQSDSIRAVQMNLVNPKYVLRNYVAQLAIDRAEQGDYSEVRRLLEVLRHPYDEQPEAESLAAKRPEWARHRAGCSMLSCSS